MKKVVAVVCILLAVYGNAQVNLVPNPSFEVYDTCPWNVGQIYYAVPWFNPTQSSPDYLNSCTGFPLGVPSNFFGFETAHTGYSYFGLLASVVYYDSVFLNYREYCEVELDSPLVSGVKYYVSFFVSLADSMNYATDDLGAFFSSDTIKNDTGYFISVVPQVINQSGVFLDMKMGWMKVTSSFIAQGGESFITIGNFKDRLTTDTISVMGGSTNSSQSDWYGGYYYLDDVCVTSDSLFNETWTGINEAESMSSDIFIYPNPCSDVIHINNLVGTENLEFQIFSTAGINVFGGTVNATRCAIDVSQLAPGVYYIALNNTYYSIIVSH